jgi:hypothetical protein
MMIRAAAVGDTEYFWPKMRAVTLHPLSGSYSEFKILRTAPELKLLRFIRNSTFTLLKLVGLCGSCNSLRRLAEMKTDL